MSAPPFPELTEMERIIDANSALSVRSICEVESGGRHFPVYALALGSKRPDVPVVGFFGGIHGLERIGTQVVLAYLHSLLARLRWDTVLEERLNSVRLVFMPLVNPVGMWRGTRCNGQGVDLMRNAPVDSAEKVPFLFGGQRLSRRLPWFRGDAGQPMEIESQAVCRVVREELFGRPFSLALDCHSGFGMRDRIWFPYACSRLPIPHLPEMHALHDLFSHAYPHHPYVFEPQCRQYLAHGDLWDHLYGQAVNSGTGIFLPLTLELGSWIWIRKNPLQLFSRGGLFNPLPMHRRQRALRRHLLWLDFLALAAAAHRRWLPQGPAREEHRRSALARWYRDAGAAAMAE